MGITGLLQLLPNASRTAHISEFRGGTVAVDSYCLLHRGAHACAKELALGQDTSIYVNYCMKYVKMLLYYDIKPIFVFDGRNLPAKTETELKRRESRNRARKNAMELIKLDKMNEAENYLKQCIDVTPQMAFNFIKECRNLNVDCIVAPYESDAQLAFLNLKGIAECVITEDSDLLVFGCKKVLYKLGLNGSGCLIEAEKIYIDLKMRKEHFNWDKFRYMCILSGCDYVNSLSGIGLKKALKFLKLTQETNPDIFLNRIPRYLGMNHLIITDEYKQQVQIANATFLHQVVFDVFEKKLAHLTDPVAIGTNQEYLINAGDMFDDETAYQLALGNLNPYTFEKFSEWSPTDVPSHSIWSSNYKPRISKKLQKLNQEGSLEKYIKCTPMKNYPKSNNEDVGIEDDLIENELKIYTELKLTKKYNEENEYEEANSASEVKTELKLSPIISNNPFLKRNISKFPRTVNTSNEIVKSRFFCSESTTTEVFNVPSLDNAINNDSTEIIGIGNEELKESQMISNKRRFSNDVVPFDNEEEVMIIDTTIESQVVKETPAGNDVKRRKLIDTKKSCKTSKCATKQKSILSFFEKMK